MMRWPTSQRSLVPVAEMTPGKARTRSSKGRQNWSTRASGSYRVRGRFTVMATRPAVWNPGSTLEMRAALRSNSPAEMSSASASATSIITSVPRSPWRAGEPNPLSVASLSASLILGRNAWIAGSNPVATPVMSASAAVNRSVAP